MNFLAVVFLTVLFAVINFLCYKFFTERQIKKINDTTKFSNNETLKEDFFASVSHELKTPLAVINNYATILSDETISEEQKKECVLQIKSTCQKFNAMISNILKMYKLENQNYESETKEFNLSEQLIQCILNFESQLDEKNIELETDIPDDIKITSDEELLSIMWNNLISNAIKFSNKGGKIFVAITETENKIIVTVADTGCGIDAKIGSHIFEKFYQGDTSHKSEGYGLGLAMVKKIADITGNTIRLESEIGKGTKFEIILKK